MALVLLRGKQHVRVPRTSAQIQLRIGIHTGKKRENMAFDLFLFFFKRFDVLGQVRR